MSPKKGPVKSGALNMFHVYGRKCNHAAALAKLQVPN